MARAALRTALSKTGHTQLEDKLHAGGVHQVRVVLRTLARRQLAAGVNALSSPRS